MPPSTFRSSKSFRNLGLAFSERKKEKTFFHKSDLHFSTYFAGLRNNGATLNIDHKFSDMLVDVVFKESRQLTYNMKRCVLEVTTITTD